MAIDYGYAHFRAVELLVPADAEYSTGTEPFTEENLFIRGKQVINDFVHSSASEPTEEAVLAKVDEITADGGLLAMELLRIKRDRLLEDCDWRAAGDRVVPDDWKTYRQALRDLPANQTPKLAAEDLVDGITGVTWPTKPS